MMLYNLDDNALDAREAVAENLEDTLAEGARWLQGQEEFTRHYNSQDRSRTTKAQHGLQSCLAQLLARRR